MLTCHFFFCFFLDDSVVVTAPTGSGKTVIFELAIVKLLMERRTDDKKIIYSKYISTKK